MHLKVPEDLGSFLSAWVSTFGCQEGFHSFELVWDAHIIPQLQEKQPLGDPKITMNAYRMCV
jgi:hypothetical protein